MTTPGSRESRRLGKAATVGILLYAGVLVLPWLGGGTRVLTKHEVLYAQPAREMLAGGSWIVPDFAGEKRVNKPPALSWFIAGSMALFGDRSEWAARLPSALFGLALVWLVASLAAHWFGRRVGVLAGLLQATTYYHLLQSRLAETDMPLAACVAAAMACFAHGVLETPSPRARRRLARGFYVAAGLSFLLKGVGPLFLLVALGCFALWTRDRRALRFLGDPVGLALFAVALVAWPLAAWRAYPQIAGVWREQTIGRFLGELSGTNPPYYYLYAVPVMLLPWLPFTVGGVRALRASGEDARSRFALLACWALPGLVLLSVSAFRYKHYAFPLLPPFTVVAALGFDRALRGPALRPAAFRVALAALAAGAGAGLWVAAVRVPHLFPRAALVVAIVVLGLGAALVAARLGRRRLHVASLFASTAVTACLVWLLLFPPLDDYRAAADLARRANARRDGARTIHLVKLGQAQVAFYLDAPQRRWDDPAEFETMVLARATVPVLFLAPRAVGLGLAARRRVEALDRAHRLRREEADERRLTLFRFDPR